MKKGKSFKEEVDPEPEKKLDCIKLWNYGADLKPTVSWKFSLNSPWLMSINQ